MRPFLCFLPERNLICTKPQKENKKLWSKIGACYGLAFIQRCWKIHRIDGRLTSKPYIRILEDVLLPSSWERFGTDELIPFV